MKTKYTVELCERGRGSRGLTAPLRYWWRIVHSNGNILATSETYKRRSTRTRVANNVARDAGWPVVDA